MSDTPTPTLLDSILALHGRGHGALRIASALGLPVAEVLRLADEAGVSLRRKGPPVGPDGPRDCRVTINLTASEWSAVAAAAGEVGTVSVPEFCRGVVVAAAGGAR